MGQTPALFRLFWGCILFFEVPNPSLTSKIGWAPSFSIAFLGQQKIHWQLTAANEISSIYLYLFLYLSIVFCLGFPIFPYALSFDWHFVLRPLHFILIY